MDFILGGLIMSAVYGLTRLVGYVLRLSKSLHEMPVCGEGDEDE